MDSAEQLNGRIAQWPWPLDEAELFPENDNDITGEDTNEDIRFRGPKAPKRMGKEGAIMYALWSELSDRPLYVTMAIKNGEIYFSRRDLRKLSPYFRYHISRWISEADTFYILARECPFDVYNDILSGARQALDTEISRCKWNKEVSALERGLSCEPIVDSLGTKDVL